MAAKKDNKKKGKLKENVFVIVPAFNEEKMISSVVADLKAHGFSNVLVVDDHSKDETRTKAEQDEGEGVLVLHHIANRGQGAALKTGIDFALQQGAQVIVTFDSDGQHQAKDLDKMIAEVESGVYDVVIGSRFLEGSATQIPWFRKMVLKGGLVFLWVMYGLRLSDAQNGLRVMNRKTAEQIEMKEDRMEHATEILHEIHKKQFRFKEVPVDVKYTDYSQMKGQSSLNSIKIAFNLMMKKLAK
ncbi:TPA: glycosyltransferase family 2 protein [Candidatus Woesearchaeota archaeon]|nr:glycosyltransferase family 2 protein [Candidatus Woesearchaeota archaeon]HIH47187.1 glycosyltransferase family 2 protein [Candidatus Woesearchaeota archaeon]HII89211.1 glycosyltransferase family 2 protein [Candidatus Woesearchaeota archaeon]